MNKIQTRLNRLEEKLTIELIGSIANGFYYENDVIDFCMVYEDCNNYLDKYNRRDNEIFNYINYQFNSYLPNTWQFQFTCNFGWDKVNAACLLYFYSQLIKIFKLLGTKLKKFLQKKNSILFQHFAHKIVDIFEEFLLVVNSISISN